MGVISDRSRRNQIKIHPPPSMYAHIVDDIREGRVDNLKHITLLVRWKRIVDDLLYLACLYDRNEIIKFLFKRGANPIRTKHTRNHKSILYRMCREENRDKIEILLDMMFCVERLPLTVSPLYCHSEFMVQVDLILIHDKVSFSTKSFFAKCLVENLTVSLSKYVNYFEKLKHHVNTVVLTPSLVCQDDREDNGYNEQQQQHQHQQQQRQHIVCSSTHLHQLNIWYNIMLERIKTLKSILSKVKFFIRYMVHMQKYGQPFCF
jgi:hypothetical protein